MRPERATAVINNVMSEWYSINHGKKFKYDKLFLLALDKMIEKCVIYMKDHDNTHDRYYNFYDDYPDYKMKFNNDHYKREWRYEMFYISDRWNCFHRLMWIKNGIDNNKFV